MIKMLRCFMTRRWRSHIRNQGGCSQASTPIRRPTELPYQLLAFFLYSGDNYFVLRAHAPPQSLTSSANRPAHVDVGKYCQFRVYISLLQFPVSNFRSFLVFYVPKLTMSSSPQIGAATEFVPLAVSKTTFLVRRNFDSDRTGIPIWLTLL